MQKENSKDLGVQIKKTQQTHNQKNLKIDSENYWQENNS